MIHPYWSHGSKKIWHTACLSSCLLCLLAESRLLTQLALSSFDGVTVKMYARPLLRPFSPVLGLGLKRPGLERNWKRRRAGCRILIHTYGHGRRNWLRLSRNGVSRHGYTKKKEGGKISAAQQYN